MKIYKTTDRIKVQIGDMVVIISPLSYEQKIDVQSILSEGSDVKNIYKSSLLCMRYAIKEVKGIEFSDGENFELSFKEGILTEECAKALLNIEMCNELMAVCNAFINNVPREVNIKGVKIINPKKKGKK